MQFEKGQIIGLYYAKRTLKGLEFGQKLSNALFKPGRTVLNCQPYIKNVVKLFKKRRKKKKNHSYMYNKIRNHRIGTVNETNHNEGFSVLGSIIRLWRNKKRS